MAERRKAGLLATGLLILAFTAAAAITIGVPVAGRPGTHLAGEISK